MEVSEIVSYDYDSMKTTKGLLKNSTFCIQAYVQRKVTKFLFPGEGCFGQVWKCEALNIDGRKGVTMVAVKTLKESASNKEKEDLVAELNLMKTLLTEPHTNVVRLLGCCTSANDKGEKIINPVPFIPDVNTNVLISFRADLRDHGVCLQGQAAGVSTQEPGRALLRQPPWLQPETHLT